MKKRYLLVILIVLFGLTFWYLLKSADAPVVHDTAGQNGLAPEVPPAQKDDLISVETPLSQSRVTSPFAIRGRARGSWYFEGSFPVTLTDSSGTVLASGHADAQGAWMTEDYVPFVATLSFTAPTSPASGFVILHKDNPSGDPAHDNTLSIPVTF